MPHTQKTKKRSKPSLKSLRKKCDDLLTPIIKLISPYCLLCADFTQVAHHHIHKSSSSRLRYEMANLIPLCNPCHFTLHHNESYYASQIVNIRGLAWFRQLEKWKNEYVKTDRAFYEEHLVRLIKLKVKLEQELMHSQPMIGG